jgi:transposase-like protein
VPIICKRQNIHPTVFYRWQRQLFSRGHVVFQRRSLARLLSAYRVKMRNLEAIASSRAKELARLRALSSNKTVATLRNDDEGRSVAYSSQGSGGAESHIGK